MSYSPSSFKKMGQVGNYRRAVGYARPHLALQVLVDVVNTDDHDGATEDFTWLTREEY